MTSSIPHRMYAEGMRRLGFGDDVTDYFDEHVEADAVHEQIAGFDMAPLVRGDPEGEPVPRTRRTVALCRCGLSSIKPFCDGTRKASGFRT